MARKLRSDTLIFAVVLLLLVVSAAFVYSASAYRAGRAHGDTGHFLVKQLLWSALGVACLLVTMRLDYRVYRAKPVLIGLVGVTLVGLLAVFLSPEIKGSHRWLGYGGLGVQPSEFAKLVTIIVMAAGLHEWLEKREDLRTTAVRIGVVVGAFVLLILREPDFGNAAALAAIAASLVFAVGLPWRWIAPLAILAPPAAYAVLISADYRWRRVQVWLNPWSDRMNDGFQTVQSLIAVGSGGITGLGFMQGRQKMFYLPEAHNDFIYAVIAEEQGLVGATIVLALFAVLIWRGFRTARRVPDAQGALLAAGITTMLGVQALVNMSVVLGLVPAKGMALPFVSAGGSSLVVCLAALGILLNVSQHVEE